jgi:hypothetical protein
MPQRVKHILSAEDDMTNATLTGDELFDDGGNERDGCGHSLGSRSTPLTPRTIIDSD